MDAPLRPAVPATAELASFHSTRGRGPIKYESDNGLRTVADYVAGLMFLSVRWPDMTASSASLK